MLHSHHLPELCYFYKKPSKTYVHFKNFEKKKVNYLVMNVCKIHVINTNYIFMILMDTKILTSVSTNIFSHQ